MKTKGRIKGILLAVALGVTSVFPQTGVFLQGAAKTAIVKTQQELDKALKNKMLKTIVVKSTSKKLNIKKGNYNKVKLEVNSAKTRIINSGKFNQITIKNADTFTEKASDNTVKSTDSKLKINVKKAAKRLTLNIAKKNSNTTIAVAGSVSHISLAKSGSKATVDLKGSLESAAIESASELVITGESATPVSVALTSDGASLTTSVKSNVDVSAKATITFDKGAEDSAVNASIDGDMVSVKNNTTKDVNHGISNLGKVIKYVTSATTSNFSAQFSLSPTYYNNNQWVSAYITTDKIRIRSNTDFSSYTSSYTTLRYTKTS